MISFKEDEGEGKNGKEVNINYDEIEQIRLVNEEKAVLFQIKFENGTNKEIKIYSSYVSILILFLKFNIIVFKFNFHIFLSTFICMNV